MEKDLSVHTAWRWTRTMNDGGRLRKQLQSIVRPALLDDDDDDDSQK